jgi:hypothetical protein
MLLEILREISGPIGAAAWLAPFVYQKLKKQRISSQLISYLSMNGNYNNKNCVLYFLRINAVSINSDFNIKKTDVIVSYQDKSNYKGEIFWAREYNWRNSNGLIYTLNIEPEDTIPFIGTIQQNITKKIYLTFRIDKKINEKFEKIVIKLTNHNDIMIELLFDFPSNDDKILWDDRIWIPSKVV